MTADALRIVKRDHADRARGQARPVGAEDVAAIVATARREGRDRDAAIAGVLFQAALRRSEASALEWRDVEPAADIPGALRIRVRRSKTDQAGKETDTLEPEQEAVVALARRVHRVLVDQQRVDHAAHLDQLLPVAAVPCKARDLARRHGADLAETDFGHHAAEAGTGDRTRCRPAQVLVDDLDPREPNAFSRPVMAYCRAPLSRLCMTWWGEDCRT